MSPNVRQALIITVLFAASLAIRGWWTDLHGPVMGDEGDYHFLANQLIAGNGFAGASGTATAWRTPGFPFFLALIYTFTGPDPAYARVASMIVSALTTPLIYLLVLLLFKKRSASIMSAAIWMFLPTSIFLSGALLGESLSAFLLVAAFLIAVLSAGKERLSIIGAIVSGLLMGAATLSRGYLILALAALPLYYLVSKKSKKTALVCLVFSVLLPAMWITRNVVMLGSPTLSTEGAQVMWHGNNRWSRGTWNGEWFAANSAQRDYLLQKYPGFFDELSETERSRLYLDETAADVSADPARALLLIPRKIFFFLTPYSYMGLDWLYLACFPFALAGLYLVLRQKENRQLFWLLVFPVLCVGAVCVLTFGDPRFRHPVDFCFVALSAAGIGKAGEGIKSLITRRQLPA